MKQCLACCNNFDSDSWCCPACAHEPASDGSHLSFAPELSQSNDGFPIGSHDCLFQLESGHFWFRARNRIILWALKTYFPEARSFLEIGCGTGFVLSGIKANCPTIQLHGSEIFDRGLHFAEQRLPGVDLYQMDARKLPFKSHFDVIGAFDVLEHIEEDDLVLEQVFKAVNSENGGVIFTVPQHKFLWSSVDEYSCHFRRYSASELQVKLERVGFRLLKLTSFNSLLLPLMMLSRLRQKKSSVQQLDPAAELRIPKLLNGTLEAVMNLENLCIQLGASLPAGGSLLAVAKVR